MQGQTILRKIIKAATIEGCLKAAASWCLDLPQGEKEISPLIQHNGQKAEIIEALLTEQRRWEQMPNQREPITPEMLKDMHDEANKTLDPHNAKTVIAEWCTVGVAGGAFRLSEWAQNNDVNTRGIQTNLDETAKAFTPSDIGFLDVNHKRITLREGQMVNENEVYYVTFRWRFQKNGVNGEIKTLARSPKLYLCAPRMAARIYNRHVSLKRDSSTPLAVFKTSRRKIQYVRATDIEKVVRSSASRVYKLDTKVSEHVKELHRFSSHSLRVGACVALHLSGASETTIKFRCRWRSKAFMDYLRDIPELAILHAESINALVDQFSNRIAAAQA